MKTSTKFFLENSLIYKFFVCIGLVFILIQYLSNRAAWGDETMLGSSIISKGLLGLLSPLDFNQVAPPLFLWLEKLCIIIFGVSDLSLRVIPLLSIFLTIYILKLFLEGLSFRKDIIYIILAIFCLSENVIYFSSEIKQYSSDCLVAIGIIYSYQCFVAKNLSLVKFIIVGIVSLFLSHIAIIVISSVIFALVIEKFDYKNSSVFGLKDVIVIGIVWGFVFGLYYIFFIYDHPHSSYMSRYWRNFSGLPPNRLGAKRAVNWMLSALNNYILWSFRSLLNNISIYIVSVLYLCSTVICLLKKNWIILFLCILPFALHLGLALFRFYPFYTRLVLYAFPLLLIVIFYPLNLILRGFSPLLSKLSVFIIFVPMLGFSTFQLIEKIPIEKGKLNDVKLSLFELEKMNLDTSLNIVFQESVFEYYKYQYSYLENLKMKRKVWNRKDFEALKELGLSGNQYFFLPFTKRKQKELVKKITAEAEFVKSYTEIDLYQFYFTKG